MKCPDCNDSKQVPLGFYAGFKQGIGQNSQLEQCRTCLPEKKQFLQNLQDEMARCYPILIRYGRTRTSKTSS